MDDRNKTKEELIKELTELRKQEPKWRSFIKSIPVFMSNLPGMAYRCQNDRKWTMEFVSDGCTQLTGYTASSLVGNHGIAYGEIIYPEDRERVWIDVQRANAQRRRFALEYRIRTAIGEEKWIWEQGIAIRSASGCVEALEGLMLDVTERKSAEEELARSRAIIKATIDSLPLESFALGPDGRFVLQNAASRLHWGDVTGKRPEECKLAKATLALWQENSRRAYAGEKVEGDVQFTVHGEHRECHSILAPIEDGSRNYGIVGVNLDITNRKQAERALQKAHGELEQKALERAAELTASEELFRVAFEEAPVGMVIVADGVVTKTNRALSRMSGFAAEEYVGHRPLEFTHPDDRETTIPLVNGLYAGRVPSYTIEKRYLKKDGGFFWARATAAGVQDGEGEVVLTLATVEDISERKQAQDALERERQSLGKMLQASDHERQILSYEIHDGLAQYLAAANMQFQAYESLRENSPQEAEKAYATAVELVRQSHAESRRLINEVRPPVIDETGLEVAISHLVHEQRKRGGPEIEFSSDVQFKKLLPILENAVYRITQEALTNACRHSKSKRVSVTLTQKGDEVLLEVRDAGIGFDPDVVREGHFGLEGIRQRVRLLGGQLTLESKPGSGTRIRVVVPILERHAEG
jgi:PAS domain S-box-containing protein